MDPVRHQRPQRERSSPIAVEAAAASNHDAGKTTGGRKRWFRWAAILGMPLLFLGLAEGALRLAGFGYNTSFFLNRQVNGRPVWIDNQDFGKRFFPPGLERFPKPVTLAAPKSADTLRIFVLGESAAMGDPDSRFGLPRLLEVLLQQRFPQRRIEVVNAAMVAINSHAILPIAQDCARRQGDLWVIYMGNNEMIGPFGALSVFGSQVPPLPLIRGGLALKTTRVGQGLDAMLRLLRQGHQPPAEWDGMVMMADQKIRSDDPRAARVYQHFEKNLGDILDAGRRAGIPILLGTVATNLKDCAPFASLHRANLTPSELSAWEAIFNQGVARQAEGKFAEARDCYQRAAAIDDQFADLCFRWAQCCLAVEQLSEARRHFGEARDRDALQFRTDSRINGIIRQSAAAFAAHGVHLLEAEEILAAKSPQGLAGANYFYEHVHLNPEGNYLLARSVAELAADTLSLRSGNAAGQDSSADEPEGRAALLRSRRLGSEAAQQRRPTNKGTTRVQSSGNSLHLPNKTPPARSELRLVAEQPWVSELECFRLLGLTDRNRHDLLARILDRIEQPPFTRQVDHTQQLQRLRDQLDRSRLVSKPAQVKRAAQLVAQEVAHRPDDADLRWNLAQLSEVAGDTANAEEQWRAVLRLLPQASLPYYYLAKLLDNQARDVEARQFYEQCLEINPNCFEARCSLGILLSRQGQPADAARQLRAAVRQKPRSVEARLALGSAILQAHQPLKAREQFQEVLKLDPRNAQAKSQLENVEHAK